MTAIAIGVLAIVLTLLLIASAIVDGDDGLEDDCKSTDFYLETSKH